MPAAKLLALSVVKPLPSPVNILEPMLMLPNPLVILPAFNAPVPVILSWCCVTFETAIRASAKVPLLMFAAAILPVKLDACTSPPTPKPPVITTAPTLVPDDAVLLVNVVNPLDANVVNAPELGVVLPIGVLLILSSENVPPAPIVILPFTSKSSVIVVVLVAAPMLIEVAAPPIFSVDVLVLIRLNVTALVVISPPSTFRSKSMSTLLLILVVPVAAPISNVVAAFAKFTVVAVALIKLNVVALVVISPPSTFKSRSTSKLLLTFVVPVAAPI